MPPVTVLVLAPTLPPDSGPLARRLDDARTALAEHHRPVGPAHHGDEPDARVDHQPGEQAGEALAAFAVIFAGLTWWFAVRDTTPPIVILGVLFLLEVVMVPGYERTTTTHALSAVKIEMVFSSAAHFSTSPQSSGSMREYCMRLETTIGTPNSITRS